MHTHITILFCLGCTYSAFSQVQCQNQKTTLVPLSDLKAEYYEQYQGGLYTDGSNAMPKVHEEYGQDLSFQFVPLDSLGNVDYERGQILFLGMGASTATEPFNAMIDSLQLIDYLGYNSCTKIRGLFLGGKDLNEMIDTLNVDGYWASIRHKMKNRKDAYLQVQALWILQQSDQDSSDELTTYLNSTISKYVQLMHILRDTFPNLKQVYLSGTHYTGYMDPLHKRYNAFVEPRGYWSNLAIRELINMQINGDNELAFSGEEANAPWLSWGPYFWADGMEPRQIDGLRWSCDQFKDDQVGGGFHLLDTTYGVGVEANMLRNFFETDPVAKLWFMDGPLWADCPASEYRMIDSDLIGEGLHIYPNPTNQKFNIEIPESLTANFDYRIYNHIGVQVYYSQFKNYTDQFILSELKLPAGIYHISLSNEEVNYTGKLIVIH